MLAEEYAVVDVCRAGIPMPLDYVMSLTPGGRPIASGSHAAAVPGFEGSSLLFGESALFAPHVERIAVLVEDDGDDSGGARDPLNGSH